VGRAPTGGQEEHESRMPIRFTESLFSALQTKQVIGAAHDTRGWAGQSLNRNTRS
jgi:hypothetical protein